jgi:hypothetical protein
LRFVALLGRDALLSGPSWDRSPLADLLVASERKEREITVKLYTEYRGLRARLFDELRRHHSNMPSEELLGYAQTILDRVLFLAFAEDRQLLPRETLAQAYQHRDPYHPQSIWKNFTAVFRSVDRGSAALGIPAYNGGLFAETEELDQLEAKGLDAVKRAVQSRLVQLAGQHGVLAVPLDLEISERLTAGVAKTT